MGRYLVTGIIQNITIRKNAVSRHTTIDVVVEKIKKEHNINFSCYNYSEDTENYYWKIQPRMLEGNFVDFLEAQASMYDYDELRQKTINIIRAVQTGDQLIALAAEKELIRFQLVDDLSEYVTINYQHIKIEYEMICFFSDGKILMECYSNIFNYFENIIRLQRSKYPVVDCVKIMISS